MKTLRLHVHCSDWQGLPYRKTFVIAEFAPGFADIVEESRPRCEADRTAVFYAVADEALVFEVELLA